jgi:hypothetical protein
MRYGKQLKRLTDTDEGDHGLHGIVVAWRNGTDQSNDDLADTHTNSSPDQKRTTTDTLHGVERDGRAESVDEIGNDGDKEGVGDRAELSEEGGSEAAKGVHVNAILALYGWSTAVWTSRGLTRKQS